MFFPSFFSVNNPKEWFKKNEPVYTATASYDFAATSSEELSLKAGQKIWLAPKSLQPRDNPGWWKATDSVNVGLIPSSYVKVVGQLKKKTESDVDNSSIINDHPSESDNRNSNKDGSSNQNDDVCVFEDLEEAYNDKSSPDDNKLIS